MEWIHGSVTWTYRNEGLSPRMSTILLMVVIFLVSPVVFLLHLHQMLANPTTEKILQATVTWVAVVHSD